MRGPVSDRTSNSDGAWQYPVTRLNGSWFYCSCFFDCWTPMSALMTMETCGWGLCASTKMETCGRAFVRGRETLAQLWGPSHNEARPLHDLGETLASLFCIYCRDVACL